MTEKRFTYPMKDDVYYSLGLFRDNGKEMSKDDVLDMLNNLHEENIRLKERLKEQNDVEWLRNNTVWEVIPSSRRTYMKTSDDTK